MAQKGRYGDDADSTTQVPMSEWQVEVPFDSADYLDGAPPVYEGGDDPVSDAVRAQLTEARDSSASNEHRNVKCPQCDTVQSATHSKCSNCGHDLTGARKAKFAKTEEAAYRSVKARNLRKGHRIHNAGGVSDVARIPGTLNGERVRATLDTGDTMTYDPEERVSVTSDPVTEAVELAVEESLRDAAASRLRWIKWEKSHGAYSLKGSASRGIEPRHLQELPRGQKLRLPSGNEIHRNDSGSFDVHLKTDDTVQKGRTAQQAARDAGAVEHEERKGVPKVIEKSEASFGMQKVKLGNDTHIVGHDGRLLTKPKDPSAPGIVHRPANNEHYVQGLLPKGTMVKGSKVHFPGDPGHKTEAQLSAKAAPKWTDEDQRYLTGYLPERTTVHAKFSGGETVHTPHDVRYDRRVGERVTHVRFADGSTMKPREVVHNIKSAKPEDVHPKLLDGAIKAAEENLREAKYTRSGGNRADVASAQARLDALRAHKAGDKATPEEMPVGTTWRSINHGVFKKTGRNEHTVVKAAELPGPGHGKKAGDTFTTGSLGNMAKYPHATVRKRKIGEADMSAIEDAVADVLEAKTKDKPLSDAVKRPGQLHRDLGVPEGEKIPVSKIRDAAKNHKDEKVRKRARLALTFKKINEAEEVSAADLDEVLEAKDSMQKASTPEPFSSSRTSNWVARVGGLPAYIQHIAHDLMEKRGKTESNAIQMAIGIVKRWAKGIGNVDSNTRAAARKAWSEWLAKRAAAHGLSKVTAAAEEFMWDENDPAVIAEAERLEREPELVKQILEAAERITAEAATSPDVNTGPGERSDGIKVKCPECNHRTVPKSGKCANCGHDVSKLAAMAKRMHGKSKTTEAEERDPVQDAIRHALT